jgi:hypothetical protein
MELYLYVLSCGRLIYELEVFRMFWSGVFGQLTLHHRHTPEHNRVNPFRLQKTPASIALNLIQSHSISFNLEAAETRHVPTSGHDCPSIRSRSSRTGMPQDKRLASVVSSAYEQRAAVTTVTTESPGRTKQRRLGNYNGNHRVHHDSKLVLVSCGRPWAPKP